MPAEPARNERHDPASPGLHVLGLARSFQARTAVDHITFTVPAADGGAIVGLLGPNGCGKSTTMKLLAGVLTASAGRFVVDGQVGGVNRLEVKSRTGFIPDVGGLFPRLTGWEHLQFAARLFGLTDWAVRARELLEVLDLADAAHEPAGGYSHGMSRKLSCAIALLPRPRLLLADEPFDGVDQGGIDTLTGLLRGAAADGAVVVVTTHLLGVAEDLCGTVHLMRSGRIVETLEPAAGELADRYLSVLAEEPEDGGR